MQKTRVQPIELDQAPPRSREEWERQVAAHGRMTNMKRTLARDPLALEVYMQWYPLRDRVEAFLGPRLTLLFSHAISAQTDCLICSTYFRRDLIESGENPEELVLDEKERAFLELGLRIARDSNGVDDAMFERVSPYLNPEQTVTLVAFAGIMMATNIFNNVIGVELDGYLQKYRKDEPE